MFCPKCKSIMLPKKEKDKTILECKCGYKNNDLKDTTFKEKIKQEQKIEIYNYIEEWKNQNVQTDDILVIGIKYKSS